QRIAQVAAPADVAPTQAEADVGTVEALAGDHVFAGEQAGAADVAHARRDRRQPGAFAPQPDLDVDRLVLVTLVAAEVLAAVATVGDIGVAETTLQPRERLQRKAVARVRPGAIGV